MLIIVYILGIVEITPSAVNLPWRGDILKFETWGGQSIIISLVGSEKYKIKSYMHMFIMYKFICTCLQTFKYRKLKTVTFT